ncbi:peroxin-3 family protein [Gracilaria domingensis]|nr:peroxin-3 family protein [Gracilaria domingensis]
MQPAPAGQFGALMRFVRRNSGRLTALTLTAGGLVAAYTYFRRQMNTVNSSIEAERAAGARSLRAIFLSNKSTIRTAYVALLPELGAILAACENIECSAVLGRLRERPGLEEKALLWEKLKIASTTHLVTAIYLVSVVYATVSLQINLLARYTGYYGDAPVQNLPFGDLQSSTSRRFLDLCRCVLNDINIEEIAKQVERAVLETIKDVRLTAVYDAQKVECLLANCITAMRDGEGKTSTARLPEDWFRAEIDSDEETDNNLRWLHEESLDLCECLDVSGVVENYCFDAVRYVREKLSDEMSPGSAKGLPFAHLLARFEKATKALFAGGVESTLRSNESGVHFSACVFLSGEKEVHRPTSSVTSERS